MLQIMIINGPNLNLLGSRETDIYGGQTFEDFFMSLQGSYKEEIAFTYQQSNVEGEIVNLIQDADKTNDGIILNAAAYTHTSVAIADAIAAISTPTIEVHISNIYTREEFRKTSLTAANCIGVITGLGLNGYSLAAQHFLHLASKTS
ncbi:MAG: type II 3-dehydroquinate dehydratase [Flavipsychrobacter sp.]